ncbi:hypothetical protein GQR58_013306 [Nymphon striatum]|nr:hypothetical protein GQR58_013306 [Nymphon striatum]
MYSNKSDYNKQIHQTANSKIANQHNSTRQFKTVDEEKPENNLQTVKELKDKDNPTYHLLNNYVNIRSKRSANMSPKLKENSMKISNNCEEKHNEDSTSVCSSTLQRNQRGNNHGNTKESIEHLKNSQETNVKEASKEREKYSHDKKIEKRSSTPESKNKVFNVEKLSSAQKKSYKEEILSKSKSDCVSIKVDNFLKVEKRRDSDKGCVANISSNSLSQKIPNMVNNFDEENMKNIPSKEMNLTDSELKKDLEKSDIKVDLLQNSIAKDSTIDENKSKDSSKFKNIQKLNCSKVENFKSYKHEMKSEHNIKEVNKSELDKSKSSTKVINLKESVIKENIPENQPNDSLTVQPKDSLTVQSKDIEKSNDMDSSINANKMMVTSAVKQDQKLSSSKVIRLKSNNFEAKSRHDNKESRKPEHDNSRYVSSKDKQANETAQVEHLKSNKHEMKSEYNIKEVKKPERDKSKSSSKVVNMKESVIKENLPENQPNDSLTGQPKDIEKRHTKYDVFEKSSDMDSSINANKRMVTSTIKQDQKLGSSKVIRLKSNKLQMKSRHDNKESRKREHDDSGCVSSKDKQANETAQVKNLKSNKHEMKSEYNIKEVKKPERDKSKSSSKVVNRKESVIKENLHENQPNDSLTVQPTDIEKRHTKYDLFEKSNDMDSSINANKMMVTSTVEQDQKLGSSKVIRLKSNEFEVKSRYDNEESRKPEHDDSRCVSSKDKQANETAQVENLKSNKHEMKSEYNIKEVKKPERDKSKSSSKVVNMKESVIKENLPENQPNDSLTVQPKDIEKRHTKYDLFEKSNNMDSSINANKMMVTSTVKQDQKLGSSKVIRLKSNEFEVKSRHDNEESRKPEHDNSRRVSSKDKKANEISHASTPKSSNCDRIQKESKRQSSSSFVMKRDRSSSSGFVKITGNEKCAKYELNENNFKKSDTIRLKSSVSSHANSYSNDRSKSSGKKEYEENSRNEVGSCERAKHPSSEKMHRHRSDERTSSRNISFENKHSITPHHTRDGNFSKLDESNRSISSDKKSIKIQSSYSEQHCNSSSTSSTNYHNLEPCYKETITSSSPTFQEKSKHELSEHKLDRMNRSKSRKSSVGRNIEQKSLHKREHSKKRKPRACDVTSSEHHSKKPKLSRNSNQKESECAPTIAKDVELEDDEAVTNEVPQTESYVLDGGSLMHRVQWTKGSTYGAIADCYVDFTLRNYGMATVVFDGYHDQPSVKDSTHQRRQQKNHPKVSFTPTTVFTGKKEEFLSQGSNKQGLINMISDRLREKGCKVMKAEGDADYDIVQAAIALSEYKTTTLIGEDTDLLILLLHHMDSHKKTLYFRSDKKSKEQRVYNINTLKECLGQQLCSQLLFIHAFTGCDTTSQVFGMGKKPFFQKVAKGDEQLKYCALAFTKPGQTADTIEQHGNQSMVLLFSGKQTDYLASLRHSVFKKKVVSASSFVAPARLPPTASATKFHSLRAYYQIMTWLGLESNLDATDWGWKIEDNQFVPVTTAKNPAPDNLLKIVHCNCTTACTTQRCTCRRYGLPCTSACGQCQLESCENPKNVLPMDQDDTEDSDDDD